MRLVKARRSGGRSESRRSSPPRRSLSSAMPRVKTGDGVSAVRSNNEVAAAVAREGNALRRSRGCLSASGVTRSMHSLGDIVAGVFSSLLVVGFTCSPITYDPITYDYLHK